jgi:hypothetical protein
MPATTTAAYVSGSNKSNVALTIAGPLNSTASYTVSDGVSSISGSAAITTGTSVAVALDLSALAEGNLTFSVTVTDILGNKAAAPVLTVVKDTTPPALTPPAVMARTEPGSAPARVT